MLEFKKPVVEDATFQKWLVRITIAWCVVILVLAVVVNTGCGGEEPRIEDASSVADASVDSSNELQSCAECPQIIDILCHCEGGGPPFEPEAHCTCENGEQCLANTCEP